ncbi:MAG: hypothetical protein QXN33_00210 [Candidatus Bathyarchaeia archaeon]
MFRKMRWPEGMGMRGIERLKAYCIRCRRKIQPLEARIIREGKRLSLAGKCPKCGLEVRRVIRLTH